MMSGVLLCLSLLASWRAGAAEVHVSAAASLTDALKEIGRNYEKSGGGTVVFNFGSSGILARQIEAGAPADLFISADEQRMDALEKKSLIDRKTRVSLLSNQLVIVVPSQDGQRMTSPAALTRPAIERIVIGNPSTVPAGTYAKQYLQRAGVWDRIQTKIIPSEDVRAALVAVESGNVDAGIVYRTDAMISRRVRIAFAVPLAAGPSISYPCAITTQAQSRDRAERFLAYLRSRAAITVFRRYGFLAH